MTLRGSGFWGWSGGGYLAAALMTKGAPHFKTAVSVAPVIDLNRYQAYGVERWMDSFENNPQGYYEVDLMNFADKLQGDLLLIHGTGDEKRQVWLHVTVCRCPDRQQQNSLT